MNDMKLPGQDDHRKLFIDVGGGRNKAAMVWLTQQKIATGIFHYASFYVN